MPDATAVVARFLTDQGQVEVRGVYGSADLVVALTDLAQEIEAKGMCPVKLLRVYRQTVPLVGGEPCLELAGPQVRVPEGLFEVRQEMLG